MYEVVVNHKNGDAEKFSLHDYTDMLRQDILRVISDVEELIYSMTENKPKEEWPDDLWGRYTSIRHRLLDKGNDVARIPDNIHVRPDDPDEQEWNDVLKIIRG